MFRAHLPGPFLGFIALLTALSTPAFAGGPLGELMARNLFKALGEPRHQLKALEEIQRLDLPYQETVEAHSIYDSILSRIVMLPLRSEQAEVRNAALKTLSSIEIPGGIVRQVANLLRGQKPEVQAVAAAFIQRALKPPGGQAVGPAAQRLSLEAARFARQGSRSPEHQAAALGELASMKLTLAEMAAIAPQYQTLLGYAVRCLRSAQPEVRNAALVALKTLELSEGVVGSIAVVVEDYAGAMDGIPLEVRLNAITALGLANGSGSGARSLILHRLLQDADERVRERAWLALEAMTARINGGCPGPVVLTPQTNS